MQTFPFKVEAPSTIPDANFVVHLQIDVSKPEQIQPIIAFINSPLLHRAFEEEWMTKNAPKHTLSGGSRGLTPVFGGDGSRQNGVIAYRVDLPLTRAV